MTGPVKYLDTEGGDGIDNSQTEVKLENELSGPADSQARVKREEQDYRSQNFS